MSSLKQKSVKLVNRLIFALRGIGGGICANIESPSSSENIESKVTIKGWAFSASKFPLNAKLQIRAGNLGAEAPLSELDLPITLERSDVAALYNYSPGNRKVGFTQTIEWNSIAKGYGKSYFTFLFSDSVNELAIGPIKVVRQNMSETLTSNRAKYKEVWDNEADSLNGAMLAVAGYDSEEDYKKTGKSTAETMVSRLNITKEDVVLEIGCGTGRVGYALASCCRKWIGCDISGKMIEYARETLKRFPNVELLELSGCDLSMIPSKSIDKLYCSVVFMHLDEWDRYRYVQEAHRVLRTGGKVYIDNLDLESPEGWAFFEKMAKYDLLKRPPNISKTSTASELLTYLKQAGFVDLKSHHSGQFVEAIGVKR